MFILNDDEDETSARLKQLKELIMVTPFLEKHSKGSLRLMKLLIIVFVYPVIGIPSTGFYSTIIEGMGSDEAKIACLQLQIILIVIILVFFVITTIFIIRSDLKVIKKEELKISTSTK